ncbi:hypothetical protein BHM03_00060333, partial [Ensete ventricosum]
IILSPKDTVTPYSPYASSSPLPLRRRLPLPVGSRPCSRRRSRRRCLCGRRPSAGRRCPCGLTAGKQHLAGWLLAAGGASARRRPSCWRRACSRPPACSGRPLQGA